MLISDKDLRMIIVSLKENKYVQQELSGKLTVNKTDPQATIDLKEAIKDLINTKDFSTTESQKKSIKALLLLLNPDHQPQEKAEQFNLLLKTVLAIRSDKNNITENLQRIRAALAGTYRYNAPGHHQTTNQQRARTEPHPQTQRSTDHTSTPHQQSDSSSKYMQEEMRRRKETESKIDEELRKEREERTKRMHRQQQETQANQERMHRQQHESYQEQHHHQDAYTRDEHDNPFKKQKTWDHNYYGSNREPSSHKPLSWAEILRQQREDLAAGNQSYEQYRKKTQQEENQSTHQFTEHRAKTAAESSIHQEIGILSNQIKEATSKLQEEYSKMRQAYDDMKAYNYTNPANDPTKFANNKFADLVDSYRKISGEYGIYWKLHKKIDKDLILNPTIKTYLDKQIKDFENIYEKIYDQATILRDHDALNLRDNIGRSQYNRSSSRRN